MAKLIPGFDPQELVGTSVTYEGTSGRNGWTGIIEKVEGDGEGFTVRWDQLVADRRYAGHEEITRYSMMALAHPAVLPDPSDGKRRPYIVASDIKGMGEVYLVTGVKGGQVRTCFSIEQAERVANVLAQESQSGQAYRVYKAVLEYQREAPPVKRRSL